MLQDIEKINLREPEISLRITQLAATITRDYHGKELTLVALLDGSVVFLADLLRHIALPLRYECIRVSSYTDDKSTGMIKIHQEVMPRAEGRHILLLDDILDTGLTLHAVKERLTQESGALSVRTCVLLKKRTDRIKPIEADYYGFEIENEFVVGYGLDYSGYYRNLPFIGVLKNSAIKQYAQ